MLIASQHHIMYYLDPLDLLFCVFWFFLASLVMLNFAIFAFQVLYISLSFRACTVFDLALTTSVFRTSFFLAISSLIKHSTASYTPNLSVSSLLVILVQITEFTPSLGLWVVPYRHLYRRSTLTRFLNTGLISSITAVSKECLCWHASPGLAQFSDLHQMGKDHFGVSHSLIAYKNDNPHSSIQGFQIVNIPPDS